MNDDRVAGLDEQRVQAVRDLIARSGEVGRVAEDASAPWWRKLRTWLAREWSGARPGAPVVQQPWRDTASTERRGWRTRAAHLDGEIEPVTEVDYQICSICRLGWVEQPYTLPPYQRRGVAAAGLAALRAEHPGLSWHTLGDHIDGSPAFWDTVGVDVPGGYRQRGVCAHVISGG